MFTTLGFDNFAARFDGFVLNLCFQEYDEVFAMFELAIVCSFLNGTCRILVLTRWPRGIDLPLSQLLPDHSTVQFMIKRVEPAGPHIKQYLVFVTNTFPLGTSGVCVEQVTDTAFSKSKESNV